MANVVRLSRSECDRSIARMRSTLRELEGYIKGELTQTVNATDSWWIGDAHNMFKEDFETSRSIFQQQVVDVIEKYIDNLNKAVNAQIDQDTANSGSISIN